MENLFRKVSRSNTPEPALRQLPDEMPGNSKGIGAYSVHNGTSLGKKHVQGASDSKSNSKAAHRIAKREQRELRIRDWSPKGWFKGYNVTSDHSTYNRPVNETHFSESTRKKYGLNHNFFKNYYATQRNYGVSGACTPLPFDPAK